MWKYKKQKKQRAIFQNFSEAQGTCWGIDMVMDMQSRMVVAMVGDYPENNQLIDGGVQAVTTYLVEGMKNVNDIDLHVITFKKSLNQEKHIRLDGFYLHVLPRHSLGLTTRFYSDEKNFHQCLRQINPHIVHAQGAGREGFLSIRSDYPSVITFHGIIGEDAKYKTRYVEKLRLRLLSFIAERYCVRNSRHNILISPYVKKYYGSKLRGESYYIPNPVDYKYFMGQRREEENRILFAGRITPRKGILDLVKAVAIVRKSHAIKLILAGSISDSKFVDTVKKFISENDLEDCVRFTGLLNESEILNEFSKCALLVLPSYQETAPMVNQQAMAAGVPVIATRICGVPDQVDDGITGLLYQPHDVNMLVDHIDLLLKDQGLRQRMGICAREKAMREYHRENVVKQTLDLYRNILG